MIIVQHLIDNILLTVWSSISPIRLAPGQSYIYSYSGRLISGIAQFDSDAALMEIKSDIVLQAEQQGSHIAMQVINDKYYISYERND